MTPHPRSWRDLRGSLRSMGAKPIRTRGSHQTWRLDHGGTFTLVCNHLNDDVPANILAKFRRVRARSREPGNPPQLGQTGSW